MSNTTNKMAVGNTAMKDRKVKLEIKNMAKKYDNGDGVENINLKIYEGEIVTFSRTIRMWKIHNFENHRRIYGCLLPVIS